MAEVWALLSCPRAQGLDSEPACSTQGSAKGGSLLEANLKARGPVPQEAGFISLSNSAASDIQSAVVTSC